MDAVIIRSADKLNLDPGSLCVVTGQAQLYQDKVSQGNLGLVFI